MQKLLCQLRSSSIQYYNEKLSNLPLLDIKGTRINNNGDIAGEQKVSLIKEALPHFLEHQNERVMLVRGDAGTGKSIGMHQLEYLQWLKYSRGESEFLPIYIGLAGVRKPNELIAHALAKYN